MKHKLSFFERLTGAAQARDEDEEKEQLPQKGATRVRGRALVGSEDETAEAEEGKLTADVYQTPDDIIIKTVVAGVKPEDLDISITRDMVTIRGTREEAREVDEEDYFHRELYWGSFSRTILLPQEIDVDAAEANERHGLLTVKLPKLDKMRQTKLKVRAV